MSTTNPTPDQQPDGESPPNGDRAYTVAEIAVLKRVKAHVILGLIKAGDLEAEDWRSPGTSRPRWRIMPAALVAFEQARSNRATEAAPARQRKRKPAVDLVDPATGKIRKEFRTVGSSKAAKEQGSSGPSGGR